jgi:hypothetical protein
MTRTLLAPELTLKMCMPATDARSRVARLVLRR